MTLISQPFTIRADWPLSRTFCLFTSAIGSARGRDLKGTQNDLHGSQAWRVGGFVVEFIGGIVDIMVNEASDKAM